MILFTLQKLSQHSVPKTSHDTPLLPRYIQIVLVPHSANVIESKVCVLFLGLRPYGPDRDAAAVAGGGGGRPTQAAEKCQQVKLSCIEISNNVEANGFPGLMQMGLAYRRQRRSWVHLSSSTLCVSPTVCQQGPGCLKQQTCTQTAHDARFSRYSNKQFR